MTKINEGEKMNESFFDEAVVANYSEIKTDWFTGTGTFFEILLCLLQNLNRQVTFRYSST